MTLTAMLHFVNVLSAALVAGGQVYVFMVIIPTKREFPTRFSVEMHNAMLGHRTDGYMKPAGLTSAFSALLILLLSRDLTTAPLVFLTLGLAGTAGVIITSRYFNLPTNHMMAAWSLDQIPANYPEIRQRWDLVHTIRASCGLLALVCYLLGSLTHGPQT